MPLDDRFTIKPKYATLGSRRRSGRRIARVRFLVAHDTGNPGASADAHARNYRNNPNPPPTRTSSAHLFVDDEEIVETIPALTTTAEQAFHVRDSRPLDNQLYGVDANQGAIGVEYCYGGAIDADAAYERYVWLLAALCDQFGLDPTRDIVSHQLLDPARRSDPNDGLNRSGRNYDRLLLDVEQVFRQGGGNAALLGSGRITPGDYRTSVNLTHRDAPARTGNRLGVLEPNTAVTVTNIVQGEPVNGNPDWCEHEGGFLWSGGLRAVS
jgi:N-acetylmuramoyl-L-alanine amidase